MLDKNNDYKICKKEFLAYLSKHEWYAYLQYIKKRPSCAGWCFKGSAARCLSSALILGWSGGSISSASCLCLGRSWSLLRYRAGILWICSQICGDLRQGLSLFVSFYLKSWLWMSYFPPNACKTSISLPIPIFTCQSSPAPLLTFDWSHHDLRVAACTSPPAPSKNPVPPSSAAALPSISPK